MRSFVEEEHEDMKILQVLRRSIKSRQSSFVRCDTKLVVVFPLGRNEGKYFRKERQGKDDEKANLCVMS
jgi:hypothetical protein